MSRPNIIVFFSDQQRWDTVGAYGQRLPVTPELDKMASEGVLFKNNFTCQPVCGPARASLQTGIYAHQTGCYRNGIALPTDIMTLPKYLSKAGYDTAYIGKWHLASTNEGGEHLIDYRTKPVPVKYRGGYDYWIASDVLEFTSHGYDGHMFDGDGNKKEFPEGRYRADAQTDWVVDYLETRNGDKPFFLFLSYIEPHHQNDNERYEGPHDSKDRWYDFDVPGDLEGTEGDWRENYPDYLGCCNALDQGLGRIRQTLAQKGLSDNTIIIYTSDHGTHFKTRNSEYKRSPHDNSIRTPMVVCGPGYSGGRQVDKLTSLIDIPATIMDMAGLEVPSDMHGRTLADTLAEETADWPEEVYFQVSESCTGRGIRTAEWTYAVRQPDESKIDKGFADEYEDWCLYNNQEDPHQRNDLVSDDKYFEIKKTMREKLVNRMNAAGEKSPVILDASPVGS